MEKSEVISYEYFCVLDFEAVFDGNRYGVTDFPVVLVNVQEEKEVDVFHRFVKPDHINADLVETYVMKKYGQMGLAEVESIFSWSNYLQKFKSECIPFVKAYDELRKWLESHQLIKGIPLTHKC